MFGMVALRSIAASFCSARQASLATATRLSPHSSACSAPWMRSIKPSATFPSIRSLTAEQRRMPVDHSPIVERGDAVALKLVELRLGDARAVRETGDVFEIVWIEAV